MVQACNLRRQWQQDIREFSYSLVIVWSYPQTTKSLTIPTQALSNHFFLNCIPKSYRQCNSAFHHSRHWNSMWCMCFAMVRHTIFFLNYQVIWILKSCYLHWSTIEFSTFIFLLWNTLRFVLCESLTIYI